MVERNLRGADWNVEACRRCRPTRGPWRASSLTEEGPRRAERPGGRDILRTLTLGRSSLAQCRRWALEKLVSAPTELDDSYVSIGIVARRRKQWTDVTTLSLTDRISDSPLIAMASNHCLSDANDSILSMLAPQILFGLAANES